MAWTVIFTNKAAKQYKRLPQSVRDIIDLLVLEIRLSGPVRGNWKNYSKLEGRKKQHHCHLKSGKPTYVAVWEESEAEVKLVEVVYAGTHEKAPY
jgi:mRNA-degrading endonuclease RelE of RelBE toxin-antitoxin system